jgi:hypothetical protein
VPLGFALGLLALGACGKGGSNVTGPPPAPPPPGIVAVFPAPRSVFVDYLSDIWAEFDQPLDPLTVNAKTVYLKIDTARLPVSVAYDSATRRVHVRPLVTLALLTTYTVELSANVRDVSGQPFTGGYLWQFTTQSVRHPSNPFPVDRGLDSPFVTVNWGGNETTAGPIVNEVYAGTDSAAVAARTTPLLYRGARTQYTPRIRWSSSGPCFWSITVENQTSGERYKGPVWRFDTPDPSVPLDSIDVSIIDFGYQSITPARTFCLANEVVTGSNYKSYMSWTPPSNARLAAARLLLSSTTASQDSLPGGAAVYGATSVPSCGFRVGGSPDLSQPLAVGRSVGPRTLAFDDDYFVAFLEAGGRRSGFPGYFLGSTKTVHFVSPNGSETAYVPSLRIWMYHLTPGPAARATPVAAAAASAGRARSAPPSRIATP